MSRELGVYGSDRIKMCSLSFSPFPRTSKYSYPPFNPWHTKRTEERNKGRKCTRLVTHETAFTLSSIHPLDVNITSQMEKRQAALLYHDHCNSLHESEADTRNTRRIVRSISSPFREVAISIGVVAKQVSMVIWKKNGTISLGFGTLPEILDKSCIIAPITASDNLSIRSFFKG